jgi:cell division protein FtsX
MPAKHWIAIAAVAVVAGLAGASAGTAATLLTAGEAPKDRYVLTVLLDDEATADQKAAVKSALSARYPADSVAFEDREKTGQRLREQFADELGLSEESTEIAESFRVVVSAFECDTLKPIEDMPGVGFFTLVEPATNAQPRALLFDCA